MQRSTEWALPPETFLFAEVFGSHWFGEPVASRTG